jgi:hypothetical protein
LIGCSFAASRFVKSVKSSKFVWVQRRTTKQGAQTERMKQWIDKKLLQNVFYGDTVEYSAEIRLAERGKPAITKPSRCFLTP